MAYTVELSFDIRKNPSINTMCHQQKILAKQYDCEFQYFMNESEGTGSKFTRNDCIHVIIFNEDNYNSMLDFVKAIITQRSMYVECVYREDNSCNLLYISGRYLKRLDKNTARDIKRAYQKKISTNKDNYHQQILNILENKM